MKGNGRALETKTEAHFLVLPEIEARPGLDAAVLGGCSVELGGPQGNGFWLKGKPTHDSRTVRAIVIASADEDVVRVDVACSAFTDSASGNWLDADHLEPWTVRYRDPRTSDTADLHAEQWGIRTTDGVVFPAFGKPKDRPRVDRVDLTDPDGRTMRSFRIHLGPKRRIPERGYLRSRTAGLRTESRSRSG